MSQPSLSGIPVPRTLLDPPVGLRMLSGERLYLPWVEVMRLSLIWKEFERLSRGSRQQWVQVPDQEAGDAFTPCCKPGSKVLAEFGSGIMLISRSLQIRRR
ncbi:uncharacterized protein WM294_015105 [Sarcoramphus papa]